MKKEQRKNSQEICSMFMMKFLIFKNQNLTFLIKRNKYR